MGLPMVLKTKTTQFLIQKIFVRLAQLISIFISVWLTAAGIIHLVSSYICYLFLQYNSILLSKLMACASCYASVKQKIKNRILFKF